MKSISRDVKSGGAVIGTIKVNQFDSLGEAGKTLGDDKALGLLNRQFSSDTMNEFRASKTRTTNPINQLNKMAKTNPELAKQMSALIQKFLPDAAAAAAK